MGSAAGYRLILMSARLDPNAGTLRNFFCHNALICMAYENRVKPAVSGVEREARLEKRRVEAEQAMEEHRKAEAAFRANYERLRAERLAREAKS